MKTQRYIRRPRRQLPTVFIWLTILCFVLLFAGTAMGQGHDDVRAQLERTDELIEGAQQLISEAGSVIGTAVLQQAIHNQKNAWDQFNRGHWGQALMLTQRARDELYRALGNIRQTDNSESEVEKQLERTDVVLEQARDRVGENPAPPARRALEMATSAQRRAWDLYREHNLRPALRLTLEARQMILRTADNMMGGPGGAHLDQASFTARFEQLQQALERVENRVAENENSAASPHIERAHQLLDNAQSAFANGQTEHADRALKDAHRELERAMRLVVADVRSDEVAVLIETAEERLDLLRSPVMESSDSQLQAWFDQATQSLGLARDALTLGRTQRALFQTRNAVNLLNRIADEVQH